MAIDYKENIVKLKDTVNFPVKEDGSPMIHLDKGIFKTEYFRKKDGESLLGEQMYVRKDVAEKLLNIQNSIQSEYPKLRLFIRYGYRPYEVQKEYFEKQLEKANEKYPDLNEDQRMELAHSKAAHPDTAGHTTGGAIDITLWDSESNKEVDMGSGVAQFPDIIYTFYPDISEEQKKSRLYLQKKMIEENFAPFLGEWWHFSYGDKEWAFYYKKPNAIYDKLELRDVLKQIKP